MSFLQKLINFLTQDHKSDIEIFIESKKPQSAAEVEHWIKYYNYRRNYNVYIPNRTHF